MALNPHALDLANRSFYKIHPSLKETGITKKNSDGKENKNYAKHAKEWSKYYRKALEKMAGKINAPIFTVFIPGTQGEFKGIIPAPKIIEGNWVDIKGNKLKKINFGETAFMQIKSESIPDNTPLSITVKEHDPEWYNWDDQIKQITNYKIFNHEVLIPLEFKREWYDEEKDNQNEVYLQIEAVLPKKTIKAKFPEKAEDYLLVSMNTVGFTELTTTNEGVSFTTNDEENGIECKAETEDEESKENIEWEIEDNPDSDGNSPVPDISALKGAEVKIKIDIPRVAAGRNWQHLSYKIRAKIKNETTDKYQYSDWKIVEQDEIDMLRQQYIDMAKKSVPDRSDFINQGSSTYFNLSEGACQCNNHSYQLWSIMDTLDGVREKLNHPMVVSSGYRCPIHNASSEVGGRPESRHIYGDAADIAVRDFNEDGVQDRADWDLLEAAAENEAMYIEPYPDTGTWVHMDWR